jgi:hypothetical protein
VLAAFAKVKIPVPLLTSEPGPDKTPE